jgi:hypothetical protein
MALVGLENRRWGNPSASSNLAPSAIYLAGCGKTWLMCKVRPEL